MIDYQILMIYFDNLKVTKKLTPIKSISKQLIYNNQYANK